MGPLELELTPTKEGEEPSLEMEGIGAVLTPRQEVVVITQLMAGAGAEQAGLAIGDEIISVDGRKVLDLGFNGTIQRIRGPEGSCIPLTVRRSHDQSVTTITVCRRRVQG
jgi:C-terminal processing protease CtpA/Prc